jgi:hypothetical protein
MRQGKFPRPVVMPSGNVGWREDELTAWLESLPRRAFKGDVPGAPLSQQAEAATIRWARYREKRRAQRVRVGQATGATET